MSKVDLPHSGVEPRLAQERLKNCLPTRENTFLHEDILRGLTDIPK